MSSTPLSAPRSDPVFGPIGLGCVTFGREIGETEAFALMDHAVSCGVRLLDTAAAYGDGASERIVGRWCAARSSSGSRVIVATKVLPPYTPANLSAVVQACRQRLEPARIDLLYLHRWDETLEAPGALETLEEIASSAGITWLGASNFTLGQLDRALQRQRAAGLRPFRVVQNNHNFAVRALDDELLAFCAAQGVAPVGYSPLGAGFLTGKHRAGVVPGSRFDVIPGHQRIYFTPEARARLARLEDVAQRTGHSQVELALAWALRRGAVTVLVGGRDRSHLDQALAAVEFRDHAALAALDDVP
ncbi:MAG: aldo/keto reductase [Opitutaceae bacterium]|nr:aldo/keto reductase [Opitutaceae bacterium]